MENVDDIVRWRLVNDCNRRFQGTEPPGSY